MDSTTLQIHVNRITKSGEDGGVLWNSGKPLHHTGFMIVEYLYFRAKEYRSYPHEQHYREPVLSEMLIT